MLGSTIRQWNTAIYARLSVDDKEDPEKRRIVNQLQYNRGYVSTHPEFRLVDEYVDDGRSGTGFNRPEFNRLMEDIRKDRINCIVVKDLSRFGRNYLETGYYLEKIFPILGVRFVAINDHYDSADPRQEDVLSVPIKNMLNELYAKDASRKMTAVLRLKERQGFCWYGIPPYGYKLDPEVPFHIVIDEKTEIFVRFLFQLALEGKKPKDICKQLEELGAPYPDEHIHEQTEGRSCHILNQWNNSTVGRIIRNPVYTGSTVYRRSEQSVDKGIKKHICSRDQWHIIEGTHEAYISWAEFDILQKPIEERRSIWEAGHARRQKRRDEAPDIFKGLLFCAECGSPMYYMRRPRKTEVRITDYRCGKYERDKSCVNRSVVSGRLLRMLVLDQIRVQIKMCVDMEALREMPEYNGYILERKSTAEGLKRSLESIDNKLHRLYEDFAEDLITEEEYRTYRKKYDSEYKSVSESLAEIQGSDKKEGIEKELLSHLTECDKPLSEELLREMVQRVEIDQDREVRITFRHEDIQKMLSSTVKGMQL